MFGYTHVQVAYLPISATDFTRLIDEAKRIVLLELAPHIKDGTSNAVRVDTEIAPYFDGSYLGGPRLQIKTEARLNTTKELRDPNYFDRYVRRNV